MTKLTHHKTPEKTRKKLARTLKRTTVEKEYSTNSIIRKYLQEISPTNTPSQKQKRNLPPVQRRNH